MHPFGGSPVCPRCQKAVYAAEQVMGPGRRLYHKPCLTCTSCNKRLDSLSLVEHDHEPYCKQCHTKHFGTRDLRQANLPHRPELGLGNTPRSPPSSPPSYRHGSGSLQSTPVRSGVNYHNTGNTYDNGVSPPIDWKRREVLPTTRVLEDEVQPERPKETDMSSAREGDYADTYNGNAADQKKTAVSDDDDEGEGLKITGGDDEGDSSSVQMKGIGIPEVNERMSSEVEDLSDSRPLSDVSAEERKQKIGIPRTIPLTPNYARLHSSPNSKTPSSYVSPLQTGTPTAVSSGIGGGSGSTPRSPTSPIQATATGTRYGTSLGGGSPIKPLTATSTGGWKGARGIPGMMSTPLCARCGKAVYFAEQVKASGKTFHKPCLRCTECNTSLDSKRLTEREGKIMCHSCYGKLHGPAGSGYALLGKAGG